MKSSYSYRVDFISKSLKIQIWFPFPIYDKNDNQKIKFDIVASQGKQSAGNIELI